MKSSGRIIDVLCICDYFLPGFRGGGPIRTLDNLRKQLAGFCRLWLFTRDRDLGSTVQYQDIEKNCWLETQDGPVYYATPDTFGPAGLRQALAACNFDIVYLNSFFSPKSSIGIYLSLPKILPSVPVLLAPRGEFSPGALQVKKHKKRSFLVLARLLGLYRDVYWHASTPMEAQDIIRQFPKAEGRIHIAADPVISGAPGGNPLRVKKAFGRLRIGFISRISPMKNLDGLIHMLVPMSVPIELDVFGPIEDDVYWKLCQKSLDMLPDNIQVRMHGAIEPAVVSSTFSQYDLFAFPTHGENFGHVVYEALRAGTPVLISDQTPWQPDESGAVTVIPLHDTRGWQNAILSAAKRTTEDHERVCHAALDYADRYASGTGSLTENLEMFHKVSCYREH